MKLTLSVVTTFALLFPFYGYAKSMLDLQKKALVTSTRIEGLSLESYDCSIAILSSKGKCWIAFVDKGQKIMNFLASPEVAAVYAMPSKYVRVPFSNLNITVTTDTNEVLRIDDASGTRISGKIDYSR